VTSKPAWDGEAGQSVFVWAEQGIGDEIMFSSLIPELYDMCSKLIVQCDARLIPLFQRSFPKDIIYKSKRGDVSEDLYDFHIPIGSLAYKFRPSLESFGRTLGGYLVHDTNKTSMLRERLLESGAKILIGISWNTASPLVNASDRNIALPELARALNSSEVQLVCLQYGDVSNEIASLKKEFGIDVLQVPEIDNRDDIDGLASLIMACDRVVSTTNATVHLAGSLGAKVDVLLPISARWIWGTKGSQSTWYNTVTPHWQEVVGDWKDSLKLVSESVM
jgi:ADP-heptose:LPS heptosyltransferase